jgi:hypothetical protein
MEARAPSRHVRCRHVRCRHVRCRHEDAPVSVSGPPGRRVVFHRSSRLAEHRLLRRIPPTPSRVPVDPVGDHPASRVAGLTVRSDPAVGDRCAVSEHGARCHLGAERPYPRGHHPYLTVASEVIHEGPPSSAAASGGSPPEGGGRSSRSPDHPRGRSSRWRHPLRRVSPPPRRYSAGGGYTVGLTAFRSVARPSRGSTVAWPSRSGVHFGGPEPSTCTPSLLYRAPGCPIGDPQSVPDRRRRP